MHQLQNKFDLSGKTAFVTGGGTGIGFSISKALAESGAAVMIASRREEILQQAVKQLAEDYPGGLIQYTVMDLSDRNSVLSAASNAVEKLGGIDIFVGNAAMDGLEPIDKVQDETIEAAKKSIQEQHGSDSVLAIVSGFTSMIPVGRLGECHDVEGMIQLLASDAGSYITGSEVNIDGGMRIMIRPNTQSP
ncbi:SDR family oxidoreductase [Pseudomaricurvus alkylphenolicus]|uniref:SDR family NAD(P)-dependent oxidoreductase n=1 Tax=Pseudomaricurvus alkylphenolicus TaxID=1306991 RepID=UPI00141E54DB|nr:SDR family oxidoreductase [Pseudomaricurvus alkylphenolicus]NIB38836.1 SDR family oxidoreductase [Pseudomaricurvus alkylphenolicus]